jgi:23S rRNA (cytidine1920-2'-O)/16S rRNA (cytidine1409-2'-O)-methyltransferase
MPKMRLDLLLVERGLAESRSKAQALVMAGQVRVDGQVELKASAAIASEALLELEMGPRFVSRGGEKLEAALDAFPVRVEGRLCADVGASTGGFSDCLLQRGAARIYTIDVGKGILHWKLRSNPRVVVMEETNARYLSSLPGSVSLVTIDASFISLKILLPVVKSWLGSSSASPHFEDRETSLEEMPGYQGRDVIALIKPQFEAGRQESAKHKGVIRDPDVHRAILLDVLTFARAQGFSLRGLLRSPLLGPKGNSEFLAWLELGTGDSEDVAFLVQQALGQ